MAALADAMNGAADPPKPDLQPFFQALTEGTTALGKEATFSQESFDAFWGKFYKQDTQFIRPSGNPLDRAGFCGMFASDDITDYTSTFVSVDTTKYLAGGAVAVATVTQRESFKYKGNANDDLARFTYVLEKQGGADGAWKIAHAHRATGQKPAAAPYTFCTIQPVMILQT